MKRWAVLLGFLALVGMSISVAAAASEPEAAPPAAPAGEAAPPAAAPETPPVAVPGAPPAIAPEAAPPATEPEAAPGAPAATVTEKPVGAAAYPDGLVHTVVAGDTLWDLSAKYLGSPWRWPELWAQNRFLTNPHFIYPGIKVVIYPPPAREYALKGQEAAAAKPAEAAPKVEAPPPPAPREIVPLLGITPSEFVRGGEFVAERPRGVGRILDGEMDKVAYSEDDVVYLSLDKDLPVGQLVGVYRVRGPISVPDGKDRSGFAKYLVGLVQVSGKVEGTVRGRVRKSFEDLLRTDVLEEEIPSYAPVVVKAGGAKLESLVITGRHENAEMATGDFVYLNRGAEAGVAVGDVFAIYGDRYQDAGGSAPAGAEKIRVLAGRAVVTRTNSSYATAYVDQSRQSFTQGDHAIRGAATAP